MHRGGVYDELRVQLAETTLTSLVQSIEFYKTQNGHYPDSLATLQASFPENSMVFVFDPTYIEMGTDQRYYHYELQGESNYYLLGVSADGQPYTGDDLLPKIEIQPNSGIGLLIHQGSINGL